jgi:hypothetical protein
LFVNEKNDGTNGALVSLERLRKTFRTILNAKSERRFRSPRCEIVGDNTNAIHRLNQQNRPSCRPNHIFPGNAQMKIRSLLLLPLALLASIPPASANPACSRLKPGHYFRIADDNTRNVNGLSGLQSNLSKDVRNFKGVVYQINWGMVEKSWGVYDFSRIDNALAQGKQRASISW